MRVPLDQSPQAQALAGMQDGWPNIRLAHEFKYLGYWIGPSVTLDRFWEEPRAKWTTRARQLGATQVTMAYKERALTTLGYVAQAALCPRSIKRDDLRVLATILRTPFCAYPRALFMDFKHLGSRIFRRRVKRRTSATQGRLRTSGGHRRQSSELRARTTSPWRMHSGRGRSRAGT